MRWLAISSSPLVNPHIYSMPAFRAPILHLRRIDGGPLFGTYAECFVPDRDPIWWNLVANRPPLVGGQIELSDAPGLGWELDEDYIRAHTVS